MQPLQNPPLCSSTEWMHNDLNICKELIVYTRVYISFWITVGISLIQMTVQFLSIYANRNTHKSNEP